MAHRQRQQIKKSTVHYSRGIMCMKKYLWKNVFPFYLYYLHTFFQEKHSHFPHLFSADLKILKISSAAWTPYNLKKCTMQNPPHFPQTF